MARKAKQNQASIPSPPFTLPQLIEFLYEGHRAIITVISQLVNKNKTLSKTTRGILDGFSKLVLPITNVLLTYRDILAVPVAISDTDFRLVPSAENGDTNPAEAQLSEAITFFYGGTFHQFLSLEVISQLIAETKTMDLYLSRWMGLFCDLWYLHHHSSEMEEDTRLSIESTPLLQELLSNEHLPKFTKPAEWNTAAKKKIVPFTQFVHPVLQVYDVPVDNKRKADEGSDLDSEPASKKERKERAHPTYTATSWGAWEYDTTGTKNPVLRDKNPDSKGNFPIMRLLWCQFCTKNVYCLPIRGEWRDKFQYTYHNSPFIDYGRTELHFPEITGRDRDKKVKAEMKRFRQTSAYKGIQRHIKNQCCPDINELKKIQQYVQFFGKPRGARIPKKLRANQNDKDNQDENQEEDEEEQVEENEEGEEEDDVSQKTLSVTGQREYV